MRFVLFCFFKQKTAYEMRISDWSSDVCSSDLQFLGYAVGGGCATTSMFAFVASAPFIFVNQLHRPADEVGLYLAVLVSGVWLGSVLTTRLIGQVPLERLLVLGNLLSAAAPLAFPALVLPGHSTSAPTIFPF